jgi:hypothetical protein
MFIGGRILGFIISLSVTGGCLLSGPVQAAKDTEGRAIRRTRIAGAVPGKGIGKVRLGMSRTAVRRALGKPRTTFSLPRGLASDLWGTVNTPSYRKSPNTLEVIYRGGRVVQIEMTSPAFKTDQGVSTATPLHLVRKVHPKMTMTRLVYSKGNQRRQHYYDDIRRGIAFEYWPDGEEINTLIVHQPGARVIADSGGVPEEE